MSAELCAPDVPGLRFAALANSRDFSFDQTPPPRRARPRAGVDDRPRAGLVRHAAAALADRPAVRPGVPAAADRVAAGGEASDARRPRGALRPPDARSPVSLRRRLA